MMAWRRTFYTLCLCQCVAMLAFGMALPFLPLYVQNLGVSDPRDAARWSGLMSSGGMIVMATMAPIWGSLADAYGRKPMVTRALFGGGLIVAAMGFVRSPEQLLILRLLQGAFSGTVSATRTLVTSVAPAAELGFVLGMMQTSSYVGNAAGPLLGGLIADNFGYGITFALTGLLLAGCGVAVVRLVHEDFQRPEPRRDEKRDFRELPRLLVRVPGMLALIGTLFFVQAGMSTISPILPLFVSQIVPEDYPNVATLTGTMLGIAALTGAVAAGVMGKLGDRLGHERVIATSAIVAGLLYLPQAMVTAAWQLVLLRAVLGLFTGGLLPSVMTTIALRTPVERRGIVFGLTATATALGNAAGPAAGAAVASVAGLRGAFVATAVALTIAGIWVAIALSKRAELANSDGLTSKRPFTRATTALGERQ
ncbi:MAG TPA: MFS transporter [Chloroflexota bacterium]|nr:MFS transporter [Chloroflexota bacterium]